MCSSDLRGLGDIGPLQHGEIANPVTPILSNILMAFSIHCDTDTNHRLYLRMRFFCELWNPFTSTLRMLDQAGNPLDLELEITGLPTVQVRRTAGTSPSHASVDIQGLVGHDAQDPQAPMRIRLKHDASQAWVPGRAQHWTGVDADQHAGRSPYISTTTDSKQ